MQPRFPRIEDAIRYTLEYYSIGKIRDHFFRYAGTEHGYSTPHHLDTWYDLMFDLHARMDDEINQTVFTSNNATQVYLFEELKLWLQDNRIASVNEYSIINSILEYNERINSEFIQSIQAKEEAFRLSENYYRPHEEVYEIEIPASVHFFTKQYQPAHKRIVKHNKFFCVENKPELIELTKEYFDKYVQVVQSIINNFKKIIEAQITRYEAGQFLPIQTIIIENQKMLDSPQANLLPLPSPKLSVKLSVPQLAFLFRMLKESDLIDTDTNTEIFRFVCSNFSTPIMEQLSEGSFKNNFNGLEPTAISFWINLMRTWTSTARSL
jgi:hypothetical protein